MVITNRVEKEKANGNLGLAIHFVGGAKKSSALSQPFYSHRRPWGHRIADRRTEGWSRRWGETETLQVRASTMGIGPLSCNFAFTH